MNDHALLRSTMDYLLHATDQCERGIGMHVSELAGHLRDSGLAEQAFELAVHIADQSISRDRILLDDFAEWLCLDVRVQRRILEGHQADLAA